MGSEIHHFFRVIRRLLRGRAFLGPRVFGRLSSSYGQTRMLVRLYYLASAYVCYSLMPELDGVARSASNWEFLWPIQWMAGMELVTAIRVLVVLAFLSALIAFQFTGSRITRIAFAVLFLCVAAVPNSLGSINHGYHAWLWISVCLIFLPRTTNERATRAHQMSYLTAFAMTQLLLLFFYTLSGFWKVLAGAQSLIQGVDGNFSYLAFPRLLANRVVQTGDSPLLAGFFIENPAIAWPLFLFVIYAQLVAVIVAFRPNLHAIWAYLLVMFHLGTWLLMEIAFPLHIMFLLLFFALSPFRPEHWRARDALEDLPVFGALFRLPGRLKPRTETKPA